MAQTKRKRRTKHRGNAAGMVETRGRTGRRVEPSSNGAKRAPRGGGKVDRWSQPPTWSAVAKRVGITTLMFIVVVGFLRKNILEAVAFGVVMFLVYLPVGFYTDRWLYQRRLAKGKG